jgi:hypothetical protein
MKRMTRSQWSLAALIVGSASLALACEPTLIYGEGRLPEPAAVRGTGAVLFDSVDENFDPVSMADMIDGRPLILAVSSCT